MTATAQPCLKGHSCEENYALQNVRGETYEAEPERYVNVERAVVIHDGSSCKSRGKAQHQSWNKSLPRK